MESTMTNIEQFKQYLKKYSEKDLESISAMFAEQISLRDWQVAVKGKENAIAETKKNFENAETIEIEVLSCLTDNNSVAGELKIIVDQKETLYVVDVLTFNEKGLISSIRAYVGRED